MYVFLETMKTNDINTFLQNLGLSEMFISLTNASLNDVEGGI